jgi:FSR family fosmidomycin resistance protein-like MFS transporter
VTPTTIATAVARSTDARVIALVGSAHFVSHIYILVLPPLFPFVRADFGVSYTELGIAIAIFNILTGLLQTPAGFLVDRFSARAVLIGGLLLGAASLASAAFVSSFYVFVAMFAFLGVANATYHPADYSLLSGRVSPPRMSQAYSIHIFAGFAGTAAAPATLLILAGSLGWRGAFLAAAALGVVVAAAILLFGDIMAGRDPTRIKEKETGEKGADSRILLSAPILLSLCFYMLLAMAGGLQIYGIVALEALWGTSLSLATTAITAYLAMSAFAVLVGGYVSARTDRHDLVAVIGLTINAMALVPIAFFDLGAAALIGLLGLSGFFNGVLQPSRDMIVRAVTPPGAFGRVFGFVTTGFNIGGVIAPPAFGYLMDNGEPRLVILGVALCALVSIPTVMITVAQRAQRS